MRKKKPKKTTNERKGKASPPFTRGTRRNGRKKRKTQGKNENSDGHHPGILVVETVKGDDGVTSFGQGFLYWRESPS